MILPPTSPLEHDHYDIAFHNLAIRNTARYSPAVFDKPEGALHDWEIFSELGRAWRRDSIWSLCPLIRRIAWSTRR
ncbi:MAG: hypothetical protein CM15mP103_04470 [Gammaproteobacteria bacterium]|nr:MAG: hypothetical protein CM15mP103_04470 [Gammaproteobacteria bacterium]